MRSRSFFKEILEVMRNRRWLQAVLFATAYEFKVYGIAIAINAIAGRRRFARSFISITRR